jgi:hypothetical protein
MFPLFKDQKHKRYYDHLNKENAGRTGNSRTGLQAKIKNQLTTFAAQITTVWIIG